MARVFSNPLDVPSAECRVRTVAYERAPPAQVDACVVAVVVQLSFYRHRHWTEAVS